MRNCPLYEIKWEIICYEIEAYLGVMNTVKIRTRLSSPLGRLDKMRKSARRMYDTFHLVYYESASPL